MCILWLSYICNDYYQLLLSQFSCRSDDSGEHMWLKLKGYKTLELISLKMGKEL